jgi:FKBP-type peptidyl-prolyl cis-trans isomerase
MRLVWTGLALTAMALSGCGQSMDKAVDKEMAAYESRTAAEAAEAQKANAAFMADVAKQPGVVTLPSGLMYKVVYSPNPTAAKPSPDATVKINYEGKLVNGSVFDSSYARGVPAEFPLAQLVPAWKIAVPMMHKGDTWELYVPSQLGYGPQAAPDGSIPANSVLIFKIELIDFKG